MAVISTTGQGQGAAQVVKQRPSQMGTIVSSFVDDYLTNEKAQQEAQQKANAVQEEANLIGNQLRGAFQGKRKATLDDLNAKVNKGEITASQAGDILIEEAKRLKAAQDKQIQTLRSAPEVNSKYYSFDELGNLIDSPANAEYDLFFGEGAEDVGYKNFDEISMKGEALTQRKAEKPKQDIPTIIRTRYLPLIKEKYNIQIDETLSPDQQDLILKSKISSLPQEAKDEITAMFLEDEDVRTNIYLKNSEAQMNTPEGAGFNDEFIDEKAKSFIEPFLGNRQVLESDIQKTGDGNKKELIVVGDKEKETYGDPVDEKIREVQQISVREPNSTRKQSITFGQNTGFITGVTKEEDGVKVRFEYKKGGETKTEIVPLYEVQSYLTEDQTKQIEETGNKLQIEYKPNIDNYIKSVVTTLGLGDKTEQAQDIKVFLKEATNIEDPTGRDNISFTYKDIDYSFNLDKPEEQERLKKLVKDSNTPKQAPKPREAVYTDDEVKAMYGKKVSKETFKKMTVKQRAKFAQNAGSWE